MNSGKNCSPMGYFLQRALFVFGLLCLAQPVYAVAPAGVINDQTMEV